MLRSPGLHGARGTKHALHSLAPARRGQARTVEACRSAPFVSCIDALAPASAAESVRAERLWPLRCGGEPDAYN